MESKSELPNTYSWCALPSFQSQLALLKEDEERKEKEREEAKLKQQVEKQKQMMRKAALQLFEKGLKGLGVGSTVLYKVKEGTWQPKTIDRMRMVIKEDEKTKKETVDGVMQFVGEGPEDNFPFGSYSTIESARFFPLLDDNLEETQKVIDLLFPGKLVFHVAPSRKRKCTCKD